MIEKKEMSKVKEEFIPKHTLSKCLLLMFVYLKLTSQIDWSWFWVISPVFISEVLYYILFKLNNKLESTISSLDNYINNESN